MLSKVSHEEFEKTIDTKSGSDGYQVGCAVGDFNLSLNYSSESELYGFSMSMRGDLPLPEGEEAKEPHYYVIGTSPKNQASDLDGNAIEVRTIECDDGTKSPKKTYVLACKSHESSFAKDVFKSETPIIIYDGMIFIVKDWKVYKPMRATDGNGEFNKELFLIDIQIKSCFKYDGV